jgi:hypothetical protein
MEGGQRRERGRRGVVPDLARPTALTFNMALATSRIPLSGIFVGSSYAKRPVNSSMPGASDSPKPKNFPLSLRMMGRKSRAGITAPHRAKKYR